MVSIKNSVDPDQLALLEASWFGSTLFFLKKKVKNFEKLWSVREYMLLFLFPRVCVLRPVCMHSEKEEFMWHRKILN